MQGTQAYCVYTVMVGRVGKAMCDYSPRMPIAHTRVTLATR
jgi:hypothetical protein